ncbi:MAG: imelysin family protein [Chitinophagales bacterium]
MKTQKLFTLLLLFISLFSIQSCGDDSQNNTTDFDRDAMLKNIGENIIVNRYDILAEKSDELHDAITNFTTNLDAASLEIAREKLLATQIAWQGCSTFEFGPAGMTSLRTVVNTYPTDTDLVQDNITNGSYNLETASNIDAKGFPALDYLLFGVAENDNDIIAFYNNQNAKTYLEDVSTQIKTKTNTVADEWNNSYLAQFKSQNGTDVGSSLGMLVNEINLDFETHIRDGKIGIPLGVRSLGTPQADKTEAFYSGNSIALAKESIAQLKELYLGKTGLGLDDNLRALKRDDLAQNIEAKFDEITATLNQIDGVLSDAVINDQADVQVAYNKMQQMIVLLKVDLSSALGVLITYQDNDGD